MTEIGEMNLGYTAVRDVRRTCLSHTYKQPPEAEVHLNNIYRFSLYFKESSTLLHHKDQLVDTV
jgi:hypothetical protein